jgi:hypothetical protein
MKRWDTEPRLKATSVWRTVNNYPSPRHSLPTKYNPFFCLDNGEHFYPFGMG